MMTLAQAAQAVGGTLMGNDLKFSAVSTDSRNIAPGDLFVALRGENFDGDAFVHSAVKSGAVAALVHDAKAPEASPCPLIQVDDTRLALGRLAAYWRAQFAMPLIALTGSNGKTTVKEMLAVILQQAAGQADAVLATQGNFNNDIGMPLTLLRLRAHHRYAVIEMGMNHAGEIEYLSRIASPDIALVNNASGAHLAGLGTVAGVAQAKGEIFSGLRENGIAVINADDEFASLWRQLAAPWQIVDYGMASAAAVRGSWQAEVTGGKLQLDSPAGSFTVALQVPGMHNARNALAAATVALALNVRPEHIAVGLTAFTGVPGRLQKKSARHGATLLDDTYNANPASMRAALEVLAQRSGRRIFVMGDMGELGEDAVKLHAEMGRLAHQLGVESLLALGEMSREAVYEFGSKGRHFEDAASLCKALDAELDADVTVLIKGSRFMKMERIVHCCIEHKEQACC